MYFNPCYRYYSSIPFLVSRCHSWVSFSGFSEAFNEVHDVKTGKCVAMCKLMTLIRQQADSIIILLG